MTLADPRMLWLLWLLPLLAAVAAGAARRRRQDLAAFAAPSVLPRLLPARAAEAARVLMLLGALALLVLAAAGPRWGFRWEEVRRKGVDVVVALDLSRSMLAEDLKPNRLDAARREIRDLLGLMRGDRVGLVVFAGVALTQVPLTLDYGAFEVFLDQLDPDWVPVGGTDLAAAVRQSIRTFPADGKAGKAVVLITDGEDHGEELEAASKEARAAGVHMFVVGIGDPAGAPIPDGRGGFVTQGGTVVLSKLAEGALKELALATEASYVRATAGTLDLERIYIEDIRGALEARQLASARRKRWEERYAFLLIPALALLFGEVWMRPRRSRWPAAALLLLLLPQPASAGWFSVDPLAAGWAALEAGDAQKALDLWLEAQVAHPGDRRIDYDLGHAHAALGDWQKAEAAFLGASAAGDPELAADAWYGAGNARFEQGRFLEAIAAYDQVLDRRPQDPDAIANRALAERRMKEAQEQAQQDQDQREQQKQENPEPQEPQADGEPPPEGQPQEPPPDSDEAEEPQDPQAGQEGEQEKEQRSGAAGKGGEPPEPQDGEQAEGGQEQAGGDAGKTDQQQATQREGQRAEAADIERDGTAAETPPPQGALHEETQPDGSGQDVDRPLAEGAMTATGAEALLQAYSLDKEQRRQERTKREAGRGRSAAGKDW